ncbi:hypothetical protein AURDEDRAFT_163515 [Auricularia subglabra TFB-10046 SS5]|nr:hypothetical protein AURDEDRAFT_163515 [Auricularia subglabra TFB-10046 SS5]
MRATTSTSSKPTGPHSACLRPADLEGVDENETIKRNSEPEYLEFTFANDSAENGDIPSIDMALRAQKERVIEMSSAESWAFLEPELSRVSCGSTPEQAWKAALDSLLSLNSRLSAGVSAARARLSNLDAQLAAPGSELGPGPTGRVARPIVQVVAHDIEFFDPDVASYDQADFIRRGMDAELALASKRREALRALPEPSFHVPPHFIWTMEQYNLPIPLGKFGQPSWPGSAWEDFNPLRLWADGDDGRVSRGDPLWIRLALDAIKLPFEFRSNAQRIVASEAHRFTASGCSKPVLPLEDEAPELDVWTDCAHNPLCMPVAVRLCLRREVPSTAMQQQQQQQHPSFLPSPYGTSIPACYLRDVCDMFVILNAWQKGCLGMRSTVQSQNSADAQDPNAATSDEVYRQKDASTPRSQRKRRFGPYHDAAASRPCRTVPRHSLPSPSCSQSDDEWSAVEFERQLVSSWTDNALFTRNGLCKKSIAIELYGREYRLVSYYNPLDVYHGKLPRASDHPLADLLDGGKPKGIGKPVQHDVDPSFGYTSHQYSTAPSINPPTHPRDPAHSLGHNDCNIHWVPIEPAQSSHMELSRPQDPVQHVADVKHTAGLQPTSRIRHLSSLSPTPLLMDGLTHQAPTPSPCSPPEYVYELSTALYPVPPTRSHRFPQPARTKSSVPMTNAPVPLATPVHFSIAPDTAYPMASTAMAATSPANQYNFASTPPLSAMVSQASPPLVYVPYYPIADAEPLYLSLPPDSQFTFYRPVSNAHGDKLRGCGSHPRF